MKKMNWINPLAAILIASATVQAQDTPTEVDRWKFHAYVGVESVQGLPFDEVDPSVTYLNRLPYSGIAIPIGIEFQYHKVPNLWIGVEAFNYVAASSSFSDDQFHRQLEREYAGLEVVASDFYDYVQPIDDFSGFRFFIGYRKEFGVWSVAARASLGRFDYLPWEGEVLMKETNANKYYRVEYSTDFRRREPVYKTYGARIRVGYSILPWLEVNAHVGGNLGRMEYEREILFTDLYEGTSTEENLTETYRTTQINYGIGVGFRF